MAWNKIDPSVCTGIPLSSWWHLQCRGLHLSKSSRFSFQQLGEICHFRVLFNVFSFNFFFLFFNIFRVRKLSYYNHPFLLFINYRGDRKRCLCCRYLNVDVLECLLKEPVHRHHCTINSDLRLGLNLMVKQVKLQLLCASWPTAILHMWIPSLQQMLVNVI